MRKQPLVALSACSLFAVGGLSAGLGATNTGTLVFSRTTTTAHHYTTPRRGRGAESFGVQAFLEAGAKAGGARFTSVVLPAVSIDAASRRAAATRRAQALLLAARAEAKHAALVAAAARREAVAKAAATSAAAATAAAQRAAEAAAQAQAAAAAQRSQPPPSNSGGVWYELRMCESTGNYGTDTGNGYYGAYQFALSTWYGLGFTGLPSEASPAVQDEAARMLQARSGWGQWPACAAELGLY